MKRFVILSGVFVCEADENVVEGSLPSSTNDPDVQRSRKLEAKGVPALLSPSPASEYNGDRQYFPGEIFMKKLPFLALALLAAAFTIPSHAQEAKKAPK